MASIKELLDNLSASNPSNEIQVEDDLVGQLAGGDAKSWQPNDDTVEAANAYGYGQGRKPFWPLSSPAGRTIGFPFPKARPHQLEAVDAIVDAFAKGQDVLFEAGTGCHAKGQGILMFDGSLKRVEDIIVGDRLMGPDSTPRTVLSLRRGSDAMYRVIPVKGEPFVVNQEHVLSLWRIATDGNMASVADVKVRDWLGWNKREKHLHKLFRVGVDFPAGKPLPIKPYWLGLYLGDGTTDSCEITKPDVEVIEEIKKMCEEMGIEHITGDDLHHRMVGKGDGRGRNHDNHFIHAMSELGIWLVACGERYIPENYKTACRDDRLEILAGLMDTDGHMAKNCFDYISKSQRLANDVVFIARSLGLAAYVQPCTKSCQNGFTGSYFRVTISGDTHVIPTRVKRKQALPRQQKKSSQRTGFSLLPVGRGIFYGFVLDGDHRYLLDDFTVTHNSGKSPIEVGVASQFDSAYLLIGRNDLVDQWEGDFEDFKDIGFYKARQRFDCEVIMAEGKKLSCSQAKNTCGKKRKEAENQRKNGNFSAHCPACPYAVNRDVSLSKPYTVMTLSLGLTIFKYMGMHPGVTKRDVLIIDECSELESEIMKFFAFEASTKTVFKAIHPGMGMYQFFPAEDEFYHRWPKITPEMMFGEALPLMRPSAALNHCAMWAIEIGHMALTRQGWVQNHHKGQEGNDEQEKIEEACERIIRMTQNMIECIESKIPHFAEITAGDDRDDPDQYSIKVAPLEARTMLQKLAAPFAKHLLFVSATTGTANMFTLAHGYQRPLVKIEAPSGFPVANRMVYSMRAGNMSAKTQAQDAPKVMQALIEVAKSSQPSNTRFDHVNHKGIVHTYNNKVTDMVVDAFAAAGLRSRVLVLRGGGKGREQTMDIFRRSAQPLILVSPSAMLGLSLNDDMGRWQAIVKVPYAYLGDPSVVHRKDQIAGWYEWQTAKDLIQTFGRIVRSETDWGQTYVLDDAFSRFYAQNWQLFPRYIQEAIWQKPD